MAWVTPVDDRAESDVLNKTAKGYFNLADYTRISGNIAEIETLVETQRGYPITLTPITAPAGTTIPGKAFVNAIAGNIETVRQASGLPVTAELKVLQTDWGEGMGAAAPDYNTLNDWERDIKLIYEWTPNASAYLVHAGVAAVGQSRFWQNRWRPLT